MFKKDKTEIIQHKLIEHYRYWQWKSPSYHLHLAAYVHLTTCIHIASHFLFFVCNCCWCSLLPVVTKCLGLNHPLSRFLDFCCSQFKFVLQLHKKHACSMQQRICFFLFSYFTTETVVFRRNSWPISVGDKCLRYNHCCCCPVMGGRDPWAW